MRSSRSGVYNCFNNLTGRTCDLGPTSTIKISHRRYAVPEFKRAVNIFTWNVFHVRMI